MWWPKPIYALLPFAYMLAGGLSITSSETTVGIVSGTLLVSAGAVILQLRHDYRNYVETRRVAEKSEP